MAKVRIELDDKGVRDLMKSPEMVARLEYEAAMIRASIAAEEPRINTDTIERDGQSRKRVIVRTRDGQPGRRSRVSPARRSRAFEKALRRAQRGEQ